MPIATIVIAILKQKKVILHLIVIMHLKRMKTLTKITILIRM